jgi:hypothetical protein
MPLSPMARRVVATIALVGLIFQTVLVAAQVSIVIAAIRDPAFLPSTICTDHGASDLPSDEAPKHLPACALCPVCLTFATGQLAVLPPSSFSVLRPAAERNEFFSTGHRSFVHYSDPPRSRGPPRIA